MFLFQGLDAFVRELTIWHISCSVKYGEMNMTFKELKKKYRKVTVLITGRKIKDALDTLALLCNYCRNTDLKTQLESHTLTYVNILKYSFEYGNDPEKEKVYHRLIRSILALADDVADDIIRWESA